LIWSTELFVFVNSSSSVDQINKMRFKELPLKKMKGQSETEPSFVHSRTPMDKGNEG